jgi:hypothetical protein
MPLQRTASEQMGYLIDKHGARDESEEGIREWRKRTLIKDTEDCIAEVKDANAQQALWNILSLIKGL